MNVIEITYAEDGIPELIEVLEAVTQMKSELVSVRVGIDPLDKGLKFSVNWGLWSPPIQGAIS